MLGSILTSLSPAARRAVNQKRAFVFDWDGTLFDSMTEKAASFAAEISFFFSELGEQISPKELVAPYKAHSGKPRTEIIRALAKIRGLTLNDSQIETISTRLSARNKTALSHARLFADANRLLHAAVDWNLTLFISSSAPEGELGYHARRALEPRLQKLFSEILGSRANFTKGPGHISFITSNYNLDLDSVLVFGDDAADYHLSEAAGVDCILVERQSGRLDGKFPNTVESLDEICEIRMKGNSKRL